MKKLILFFCIMFLALTNTIRAIAETWDCGASVICSYDEDTKILTIAGEGNMINYSSEYNVPWHEKEVLHAVITGNVTSIGDRAFKGMPSLQTIRGTENITSVGIGAFIGTQITSIDLPSAKEIKRDAFYLAQNLEFVGLPDGVTFGENEYYETFGDTKIPQCKTSGECGSCANRYIQSGVGCVDECEDGYYATSSGQCAKVKLRYTLQEADKATSNDNENMIEWIFE